MTLNPIRVWITKYALSEGIIETTADHCLEVCPDGSMIAVGSGIARQHFHNEGLEWHRSLESATKRAEDMQKRKVASLQESIDKVRAKRIEVKQMTYD
jgi:hypothetical protein